MAKKSKSPKKDRSGLKGNPVNSPSHYTSHPSGIEAIQIAEHMSFCLGNVLKYIWRADLKDNALTDLRKAAWYLGREIWRREQHSKRKSIHIRVKPKKT